MAKELKWFGGQGLNQRLRLLKSRFYQIKLHAQGSGLPKIRPVSPDAQLAHVEPLRKNVS